MPTPGLWTKCLYASRNSGKKQGNFANAKMLRNTHGILKQSEKLKDTQWMGKYSGNQNTTNQKSGNSKNAMVFLHTLNANSVAACDYYF